MTRIDPANVHGIQRLRQEYLERHPNGGDFKAFLQKYDAVRDAIQGDREPLRWYGLTFGQPGGARSLAGADNSRGLLEIDGSQEVQNPELVDGGEEIDDSEEIDETVAASLPKDDAGRLALLQRAGLATGAATFQDALKELELPFMFAGREQWVQNIARGAEGDGDPRLHNVSMESILREPNALNLLLGRAQGAVEEGRSLQGDVDYWKTLVPSWAPGVRDQLAAQGIPFSVELLASPEMNLTDPSQPLFTGQPSSLFNLGVLQEGERSFLNSMSAPELMTQVWPLYQQYFHRPAGAPVPPGFEAGLTFGSPATRADGTLVRSPIMDTDVYRRWSAAGAA
jgi:hypothetical protein